MIVLGLRGEPEWTSGAGGAGGGPISGGGAGDLTGVLARACRLGGGAGAWAGGLATTGAFLVGDGDGATGAVFFSTAKECLAPRSILKVSLLISGTIW